MLPPVHVSIPVVCVQDEAKEQVKYAHWMELAWNDYGLRWEPEDNDGLLMITIRLDAIWQPDIVITEQFVIRLSEINVNSSVMW